MEYKLKFKYILLIITIYTGLTLIDWYGDMDYTNIRKEETVTRVDANELLRIQKKGDYNVSVFSEYNWESNKVIKYTKTNVPFVFNEEVLSESKPSLVVNKY